MEAGLQVPDIPSDEIAGNDGGILFAQSGLIVVNTGIPGEVMDMSIVTLFAQGPGSGVKV